MIDWSSVLGGEGKPRYLMIADAIAEAVRSGALGSGDRLPPQRKLAEKLGVDYTTVSRGYAEAQTRGLVDSHVGRGTFVSTPSRQPRAAADPDRAAAIDYSMNMPPEPTDPELTARMQEGLEHVSANLVHLLRYQSPNGGEQDKQAASTWLSLRGMVPSMQRIAVTPGAHLTMMAILNLKAAPGDTILAERITYPGVRAIAARLRLRLVGLEMDESGVLPDALEAAIKREAPKALYLNPTLHNPTTITIPAERRLEISHVLSRHGLPLIEDDAYGFIPAKAPPPIALSEPDLTWHIGGLAKCIGAGLRLAFTVAPSGKDALALAQALKAAAVMPSPVTMALATQWIKDGTADHILRFIRAESQARQQIAADVLNEFDFQSAQNAFNLWLHLPSGIGRAEVVAQLSGRKIGVVPSDAFVVDGEKSESLRVCLGGPIDRDELRSSLEFLAHTMSQAGFAG